MDKYRVVIDTNVLISGVIQGKGFPYRIVRAWEQGDLILITSAATIEEASRVLKYPRIKSKYGLDDADIKETVLNLTKYSVFINDLPGVDVIKEDPSDNSFLAAALSGKADHIISGDAHLQNLNAYGGIEIMSPKTFWAMAGR
ncbi:MAG: putative toxin-antitoxin system toxin component, PIN family [Nitrospirae bacterium]|nr:putative toxin-antitoxin system toxin component, PIN family [Nitrospirota bacterium]